MRCDPTRSAVTATNPRGIPAAPFVDKVEDYVSSRAEVEQTLRSFQEMIAYVASPRLPALPVALLLLLLLLLFSFPRDLPMFEAAATYLDYCLGRKTRDAPQWSISATRSCRIYENWRLPELIH